MEVQSNYLSIHFDEQRGSLFGPKNSNYFLQPLSAGTGSDFAASPPAFSPPHFYYQESTAISPASVDEVKMECLGTPQPNLAGHNDQTMRAIKSEYQEHQPARTDCDKPSGGGNGQSEVAQMDLYRDLILCHLIQDITNTCSKLRLPTELSSWCAEECEKWIQEMCSQFQLASDPKTSRRLNGRQLLALSVEEFIELFPNGGDTLHAQLQLWKTAFESFSLKERPLITQSMRAQNQVPSSDARMLPNNGWPCAPEIWPRTTLMASNRQMHTNSTHFQQQHQQQLIPRNCNVRNPTFDSSSSDLCSNISPSSSSATNSHDESLTDDDLYFYSSTPSASGNEAPGGSSLFYHARGDEATFFGGNHMGMQQQISRQMDMQFYTQHQQLPPLNHQQQEHQRQQFNVQQPSLALTSAPSRPLSPIVIKGTGHTGTGTIHLWHFIRELLEQPKEYGGCIRWVDRKEGTFKIESSHHLARYWGMRKNRSQMNYDKLSRSLRQYYKKGIIQKPEKKQRLVYKFLPPYNQ